MKSGKGIKNCIQTYLEKKIKNYLEVTFLLLIFVSNNLDKPMEKNTYSCFTWSLSDVERHLQENNEAIGKQIELTDEDKEYILDEAITECEDKIITIINEAIQNIISNEYNDID